MTKQERIEELESEVRALRRNVHDYKARHDIALSELSDLAQGIGAKPSWYDGNWQTAMMYKAGQAVARIGKMALREAP